MVANTVVDVILGEAVHGTREQRFADMLAIASVIANRATLARATPESIVAGKRGKNKEFDAYGKSLPKGVDAYRDLAEKAWNQVQTTGPVHNGTYYATPNAKGGLPKGLTSVTKTKGHEFFADPKGRSFYTAHGAVTPAKETHAAMMAGNLVPLSNPYAGLVPPTPVQTVSLPEFGPIPTARPDFPAAPAPAGPVGLAALAPRHEALHQSIQSLHPAYQARATDFVASAQRQGIPVDIASAHRSNREQAALYAQGRTMPGAIVTNARPGRSHHNFGLAFDVVPSDLRSVPNWSPEDARWGEIGDLARGKGLTWGGDFRSITDMPHIQAPGVGLSSLRSAPVDAQGYPQLTPERELSVRGDFVPTPTDRPTGTFAAPVGPVERAELAPPSMPAGTPTVPVSLPSSPAPSFAPHHGPSAREAEARSMSALARSAPTVEAMLADRATQIAVPSPAMGARAASELQGYVAPVPSPAQAVTPPAVTQAPALSAPRSIMDKPVAAPPVPSIVNPSTAMSRPSMPAAVPPTSVTTSSVPLASIGSFPEAPMDPGREARSEAAKGALLGLATGGLPGAILGGLLGPARAQIGRNIAARQNPFSNIFSSYRGMFGDLGRFSSIPAPNYGATPYSVGSGYGAIGSVFGAPAGATAISRSNPEVSFTSLGNGYVSRSNSQYGTSYTMGPGEYDAGMFSGGKSGGKGGKK